MMEKRRFDIRSQAMHNDEMTMVNGRVKTALLFLAFAGLGTALSLLLFKLDGGTGFKTDQTESSAVFSARPVRIICGTPGLTEIVFSLGCGDRVVGVSRFSTYPPEVEGKARIGGLIDPSREKILSLKPDLYLSQGRQGTMADFCRKYGIPFFPLTLENLSDLFAAIRSIGGLLNARTEAEALCLQISKELAAVRDRIGGRSPRTVFLSLGHTPGELTGIMTMGEGTFLHELLELAGGRNIFSEVGASYPQISKEVLISRQPRIIIEIGGLPVGKIDLLRQDWQKLSILEAVAEDRIYFLTEDFLLIPGVRVGQTADRLARVIHPEAYIE
ncbi:MAG: helical backbone metal receptor [Candidatus Aminicenantes bacterium]|nr:helical backbone metal receptor [Candidatus Aminicenantes bacterium]